MVYDILYYSRDTSRRFAAGSRVPDNYVALPRTAPRAGNEVAVAVNSDPGLPTMYGYDSEWHDLPPKEAVAWHESVRQCEALQAAREEEREAKSTQAESDAVEKCKVEAFGKVTVVHRDARTLKMERQGMGVESRVKVSLLEMRAAAAQRGPLGEFYSNILMSTSTSCSPAPP